MLGRALFWLARNREGQGAFVYAKRSKVDEGVLVSKKVEA